MGMGCANDLKHDKFLVLCGRRTEVFSKFGLCRENLK